VSSAVPAPSEWPGERLGFPRQGHTSIARAGRRIAAIAIDWGLAYLIGYAFSGQNGWVFLGIFAISQVVFEWTIGGSIGHRLLGLRLVKVGGGYIGLWRPLVRTALLCLVVPALVWDSDQRGFHDKVAGTVLIRYVPGAS